MVDENADARLMPLGILTERECFPHQIRTALPQRVVEAFNMRCLARLFADWTVPFAREHTCICFPEVTIADRPFAIIGRKRLPELAAGLRTPIAKGQPNDPTRLPLQGNPDPYSVAFASNK